MVRASRSTDQGYWDRLLDFHRIGSRVESMLRVLAARTEGEFWMGGGVKA